MILKNCQAGYQAASYGILVSNYLAAMFLEKVEVLTRQQPCIFHVFRIKLTNNDISFCTASVHFGRTISCLKNCFLVYIIPYEKRRNKFRTDQHKKPKSHFQSGLTNNNFSKGRLVKQLIN